jgi:aerobic-type carbon monoxide dehydrogenase small subunit (CoxS/CutS family)
MTDGTEVAISCKINGTSWHGSVPAAGTLLDLLRRDLGMVGTKRGCELLTCGVCTVLVDGRPVSACGMFAVDIDGTDVRTIEGLRVDGELNVLQRAFADRVAAQCGFCTSGQLMAATALIESHPGLARAEIVAWMRANLCRCGSYVGIVEAITDAHAAVWGATTDPSAGAQRRCGRDAEKEIM